MDNAQRNKLHGVPDEDARVDVAQMADKVCRLCNCLGLSLCTDAHPQAQNFRYIV